MQEAHRKSQSMEDKLNQRLAENANHFTNESNSLQDDISKLLSKVSTLSEELKKEKEYNNRQSNALDRLRVELKATQSELFQERESKRAVLEAERSHIEATHRLEQDLTQVRACLQQDDIDNGLLRDDNNRLRDELIEMRKCLDSAEKEKSRLEGRIGELHSTMEAEVVQMTHKMADVKVEEQTHYRELHNQIGQQLADLKKSYAELKIRKKEEEKAKHDCNMELAKTQATLAQEVQRRTDLEKYLSEIQDYVKSLINQNQHIREQYEMVVATNADAKMANDTLAHQVSILRLSSELPEKPKASKASKKKTGKGTTHLKVSITKRKGGKGIKTKFDYQLPFTVGTSTGASFSVPVTVQEVLAKELMNQLGTTEGASESDVEDDHLEQVERCMRSLENEVKILSIEYQDLVDLAPCESKAREHNERINSIVSDLDEKSQRLLVLKMHRRTLLDYLKSDYKMDRLAQPKTSHCSKAHECGESKRLYDKKVKSMKLLGEYKKLYPKV